MAEENRRRRRMTEVKRGSAFAYRSRCHIEEADPAPGRLLLLARAGRRACPYQIKSKVNINERRERRNIARRQCRLASHAEASKSHMRQREQLW